MCGGRASTGAAAHTARDVLMKPQHGQGYCRPCLTWNLQLCFCLSSDPNSDVGMCFMFYTINTYFTEHLHRKPVSTAPYQHTDFLARASRSPGKSLFVGWLGTSGKTQISPVWWHQSGEPDPRPPSHVYPYNNVGFQRSQHGGHKYWLQGDVQRLNTAAKAAAEPWGALCCPCTWRRDVCDKLRTGICTWSPPSDWQ